jgi:phospholipid/cholesterol/gamma-HCH transport system permease protein
MTGLIDGLGRRTLELLRILGHHATFFVDLLRACPAALRRPYLVVAQIHAIGNLSLVIIVASGWPSGSSSRCRCTTRWSRTAPRNRSA